MIYLDYSATTPVNKEVLKTFNDVCINYVGNSNSLHKLGLQSRALEQSATDQIKRLMNAENYDVIYTSGSSESNNLAIKGICLKYKNMHIITTDYEHSSIYGPIDYLVKRGFKVDILKSKNGIVDLKNLEELINDNTILVSVASVNSEIGLRQPVEEIAKIVKKYPRCFFHSDMTQSIGKVNIDISGIDLISFSSHKFYGLKGIGVLLKKKAIVIEPLINGGKSTTVYRSGTPALPLIVSLSKALRLAIDNVSRYEYICDLNKYLKEKLSKYNEVVINSNCNCIPHILNISLLIAKPESLQHALEEDDIYISTKSACSNSKTISRAVYSLTNDKVIAMHSIRISISHMTSKEEIDYFIESFDKQYKNFISLNSKYKSTK